MTPLPYAFLMSPATWEELTKGIDVVAEQPVITALQGIMVRLVDDLRYGTVQPVTREEYRKRFVPDEP